MLMRIMSDVHVKVSLTHRSSAIFLWLITQSGHQEAITISQSWQDSFWKFPQDTEVVENSQFLISWMSPWFMKFMKILPQSDTVSIMNTCQIWQQEISVSSHQTLYLHPTQKWSRHMRLKFVKLQMTKSTIHNLTSKYYKQQLTTQNNISKTIAISYSVLVNA